MAVQLDYPSVHGPAFAGQRADLIPETVISRTAANGSIAFGSVVVQAEDDHSVTTIANLATNDPGGFVGIAVRDQAVTPDTINAYSEDETAGIMTKGSIWVQAYETVAAGDPVYFVTATGALGKTSASSTLIPGARWDTSRTGAGLAKVRLG